MSITYDQIKILKQADLHRKFLTKFEENLVDDRIEAVREYGLRTRITDSQDKVLKEIADKLGIEY